MQQSISYYFYLFCVAISRKSDAYYVKCEKYIRSLKIVDPHIILEFFFLIYTIIVDDIYILGFHQDDLEFMV